MIIQSRAIRISSGFALTIALVGAKVVEAQAPRVSLAQPTAGDCSLTITVPDGTRTQDVHVFIDGPASRVEGKPKSTKPLVLGLTDAVAEGSTITVRVGTDSDTKIVAPRTAGQPIPAPCSAPPEAIKSSDDRTTFEASGYLGTVFDNFAPNAVGGYANDVKGDTKHRFAAGIEAQYRLFGRETSDQQFWVSTQTLHGMRSGDVDCSKTPEAAICKTDASNKDKFLYVLEHASTMEAHIDARFEFARLQAHSDTPVKAYVFTRWGFLALDTAPRVFNSDTYVGIGILAPKGTFKGSLAQVGYGRSEQFQSHPDAARLKIFGTLAFDLIPSAAERAVGVLGRAAAASRVFIAIVVDRNPHGMAPEAVQTYVGYVFDIRRAFGS